MNLPNELLYSKSHEWVLFTDETTAKIGLTDFAQQALGDLVFVNLPQEGDLAVRDESIADVESVKAVSEVYSPVSGTVRAINEALLDAPEQINQDPYGAWLFEIGEITDRENLLTAAEYALVCQEEA
ncbi:MAG: glycine cleavage system protein GcvH [Oscillospiraceae bacterium]